MNDTEKIIVLEQQLKYVLERMEKNDAEKNADILALNTELQAFHTEFNITKTKIEHAQAWGRGVIWAVIGISGFLTQWGTIVAFIKKHI